MITKDQQFFDEDDVILEEAIIFATTIHKQQKDKAGEPYILHCLQVMRTVEPHTPFNQIVGVLHDTIEDTRTADGFLSVHQAQQRTYNSLQRIFGSEIAGCVSILTKNPCEDYIGEYIPRLMESAYSAHVCQVKIADLEHNLDVSRFWQLADPPPVTTQSIYKYLRAMRMLGNWEDFELI